MIEQCDSTEKFKQFLLRLWEHDLHRSEDGNTLIGMKQAQLQIDDDSAAGLSQKILHGLDAAINALSLLVPEGKQISPFAESEVALLCADLGLQLEAGMRVKGKFLARTHVMPVEVNDVAAKNCPAFVGQNRCTGNACGLECLPIPL